MDEKLLIPNALHAAAVNNRLHYYLHGKSNMYEATKDIWYPYIYRSLASIEENCRERTLACRNLKILYPKGDLGKILEPKEPN